MNEFTELGGRIVNAWSKHKYDIGALPDVAANELTKLELHRVIDYNEILNWVGSSELMPFQMNIDATFGEPPLTVFWHPRVYVEALFWASSTTAVHGHGFVGAFQVLAGNSLQSIFEFHADASEMGLCRLGELRQTGAMLLRPGSTQKIAGGERFIHSVFHLGYPSVTIVVRTHARSVSDQYGYYRPGVALPYRYERMFDQLTYRLLQVARLQAILKSDELCETVARIGRQCELAASFKLLETVQPILYAQQRIATAGEIIATLSEEIGLKPITAVASALTTERLLSRLNIARLDVVEDRLRLCLALLLTQQERTSVMSIVRDYVDTADPGYVVANWLCELGRRGVLKIGTDEKTERLLRTWITNGRSVALGECSSDADSARRVKELASEPLLVPLLGSPDARPCGATVASVSSSSEVHLSQ